MVKVERYVYAVGKHLPMSHREDIKKEIRSTIEDIIEERVDGETPTEQLIDEILLELGEPREFARNYRKDANYLIGPGLYDTYKLVLKIGLILAAIGVFSLKINITPELSESYNYFGFIFRFLLEMVDEGVHVFGLVTISFFLIQWFGNARGKDFRKNQMNPAWHPSKLEAIPKSHVQIKYSRLIATIIISVLTLVIFNFFAEKIGIYYNRTGDQDSGFLQILSLDRLTDYMIFWNIELMLVMVISLYILISKRYTLFTVVAESLLSIATIVLLLTMVQDTTLINNSAISEAILSTDVSGDVETFIRNLWRIALAIIIVFMAVNLFGRGKAIFKFLK
ncbi:HAAS signaling domain-containing protein [Paenibacillus luteus]|uniref:HAAS signaling domain-containing protein n=1 Tax=Paenibacillus luteus TaxID=2545753 RepID=UPI00114140F4|nr:hypothetical protein [Paenibacillus luteus]